MEGVTSELHSDRIDLYRSLERKSRAVSWPRGISMSREVRSTDFGTRLGANNFGRWVDATTATAIIDRAIDVGVNFIDTADIYADGRSEDSLAALLDAGDHRCILRPNSVWVAGLIPYSKAERDAGG